MSRLSKVNFAVRTAIVALALSCLGYAYEGYPSLKIGVGARELAMGSTGVASAGGANASFFNPALIGSFTNFRAHLSHTRWFLDSQRSAAFFARPISKLNLGLGIVGFDAGKLEFRNDQPTEEPLGYFGAQDLALFASLAGKLDPKTSGGLSLKFYYEKLYLASAAGFGLDFGLCYRMTPQLTWGFSITNFSSLLTFKAEPISLPTNAKLGCSLTLPFRLPITLAQDLTFFFYSRDLKSSTGLEIGIHKNIFLRAGYRLLSQYQREYKLLDPTEGLSVGLGLKLKGLSLDYAYLPYGLDLGSTHHLSLNIGN